MRRSKLSRGEAESIMQAQMSIDEKVQLADVVIWNEGPIERLDDQTALFLERAMTLTS